MNEPIKYLGMWVVTIGCSLLYAVTLQNLWSWFVTPLGVGGIGYVHAYGLSMLVGIVTFRTDLIGEAEWRERTILSIVLSLTVLSAGWCMHMAM